MVSDYEKEGPLDAYFREISGYPPLSLEEELELGKNIQMGNIGARDTIVNHNLQAVVHFGKRYFDLADPPGIISVGNSSLTDFADEFDPSHKRRLIDYAKKGIRASMWDYIAEMGHFASIPRAEIELVRSLPVAVSFLTNVLGHYPSVEQIKERLMDHHHLSCSAKRIRNVMSIDGMFSVSLDDCVPRDNEGRFDCSGAVLTDALANPDWENILSSLDGEESKRRDSLEKVMSNILRQLSEKERNVLVMRGVYGMQYKEVAKAIGSCTSTAFNVYRKATQRARLIAEESSELRELGMNYLFEQ
ncbi:MAG: sigma-70 family RNA polymerase sigma factor [Nanoarchaeota archaeon]|nr:sigma-70 family RNA polymerase sigma factor [Nanoarchaeota archaeon]MBU1444840.1 sigma-70 family RNA polymerase sigma factor [Nanoarchaeota archaeon]MBU2406945.1 sigma-70 family RNA polymerase sigma factor [Nanoarchaeota archaeon]MBU2420008.1 sigma-70 family RNA polymerase sigma factor [Nanoarchaeota archaeon]MBU2475425.1 sigma-70 family RNA polymerase sigma factor [Nanoarchaeota archaeon]